MGKYIVRRAIQAIPVIFLIAVVSFMLMQAAPGGPAAAFNQNPKISEAQKQAWLARWCLEKNPDFVGVLREFGGWMGVWNCEGGTANGSFFNPVTGLPNFLPRRSAAATKASCTATSAIRSSLVDPCSR